jgi:hypothetical protein
MTDERDKPSRAYESRARPTARDVPFARGPDSESELAPVGQRPAQLPRDPTYEAELAQVEFAVLRDPSRREEPTTRRRGPPLAIGQSPEVVTPESPSASSHSAQASPSPDPPASSGRAVASGTLLSIGAVDPRGKTERTLETPRMYFSQADAAGEVYFKPGKIPAVTVHQTIETETVKLAESIDPRRAKTIPRIDRAALARYAEQAAERRGERDQDRDEVFESDSDLALPSISSSSANAAPDDSTPFFQNNEAAPLPSDLEQDGQIHASLSPFLDQAEPSLNYGGVPTRVEPLAGRRASDVPPSLIERPDPSAVPTQRDLPQHRLESIQPPAPSAEASFSPGAPSAGAPPSGASSPEASSREISSPRASDVERAIGVAPGVETDSPTVESIAAWRPAPVPLRSALTAFAVALLVAVALGSWYKTAQQDRTVPNAPDPAVPGAPAPEVGATNASPAQHTPASKTAEPAQLAPAPTVVTALPMSSQTPPASAKPAPTAPASAAPAPARALVRSTTPPASLATSKISERKPASNKPRREPIF